MTQLRVGFASVYAWRPHVEHMMFLARLVRQAGHAAVFLACDADLPACYTRELRDVRPDWLECLMCRAGGVRSYAGDSVSSIGALAGAPDAGLLPRARAWAASSASTLGRFESPQDYAGPGFAALADRLAPSAALGYAAAAAWIRRERLDAVCVFNGRMDVTRGIFEAARDAGIRVVTFERSWFGDGVQLLPDEHCLGLDTWHAMVRRWSTVPLSESQARTAAGYVAARLMRVNLKEWRAYNTDARDASWPVAGGRRRILVLPGSLNETWGHRGWEIAWGEATAGFDAVIAHLGLQPSDLVMRCHPNWSERIGRQDGHLPEAHYTQWARARGIHTIPSADKASTMSLIAQCDAVLLASGSAAIEAAALGKQVIAIAPSHYQEAGFRSDATSPRALQDLKLHVELPSEERSVHEERLRRGSLRFLYTVAHRLTQYVDHVRSASTTSYRYVPGADPERLIALLRTGVLQPDDGSACADAAGEDRVLAQMRAGDWQGLQHAPTDIAAASERLRRRWFLQPVDFIRDKMPVGDR